MKKIVLILICITFSSYAYSLEISCNFFVDKIIEGKNGKFSKSKIYDDEKKFFVKINKISKKNGFFEGVLNGANHTNRKVTMFTTDKFIEILQSDAYSTPYRSIYTIFTKQPSSNGGFLSSMYTNFQSNWGHAEIRYYRGNCFVK